MATGIETGTRGAALSPAARALLERRASAGAGSAAAGIAPRPAGAGPLPLSFAQQRLWFLEQLEPGNVLYNVPLAIRLRGALDVPILERALAEMARRHESMRTAFGEEDGRPVQIVAVAADLLLPLVRLKAKHREAREETTESYFRLRMLEEARRPFNVRRGPLVRAVLHRVDRRDHLLLVTMHHLVSDGWSTGIVGRELGALYAAYAAGLPSPLPEPPIQYADYALWQRERLAGAEGERQLAYWERQLADLEPLALPTDHPRPVTATHRAFRHGLTFPRPLADALRDLGGREGATVFMAVLAAFQAVLARHAGQEDVAVGTPIAGRTRAETEGLIGFFVNTLVLRTNLGGNPSFRELLGRARAVAHGAYANQDVPFERLVERLRPARDLGRTPLFQVFLNMRNLADAPLAFDGLEAERVPSPAEGAKFDLSLEVADRPEGLWLELVADADLFAPGTVERLGRHLRELVEAVVADPERRLAAIPLSVPARERSWAPEDGTVRPGAGFVRFPSAAIEQAIGRRFGERVVAAPDALAIWSAGHSWSYGELDRAANRVAHALRERVGGGPGRIALLFDHGAPAVAAMLGVLKSGHAYVPLDPYHPPDRLAALLADAAVGAIVAADVHVAAAQALVGRDTAVIDAAAPGREDAPNLEVPPDAPAYLLYTSGSTGQPKGVVQSHRNALHHVRAYTNALGIGAGDRLTGVAPYGTDAAVMDVFGALLNGAGLHLLDLRAEGPERVGPWLTAQGMTLYHSTPTVFRAFLDTLDDEERFPGVRAVVLGGEAALPRDVERCRGRFAPDAVLVNGLGPTESTTALQAFLRPDAEVGGRTVPVGHSVEETEILLLDRGGNAIAGHGVGEIAIRSRFVALGYWRRPEQTAAAFGDDDGDGGKRTYRTGDLGRTLGDGSLEHVGRKDFQVKIRGFRVEPGEVEAALRPHPAVREAAVVARDDAPGGTRLVAYVVPDPGAPLEADDLRRYLRAKLPEPMVPAAVVLLERLPLTASGKLDRRSLPASEAGGGGSDVASPEPRTATEAAVAAVWRRVLGVDRIGVNDHFFDLGGHSLLVAQVVARLREAVGVELPVRALFEAPTVGGLAERVEAARAAGATGAAPSRTVAAMVPLQPEGSGRPVFLVPGGAGDAVNLFKMTKLARSMGQDRPFFGFFAPEIDVSEDETPQAWAAATAAAHVAEIRARQPTGPYILAGTCLGGVIAFEMAQQLIAQGEEVLRLILFDAWRPGARRGFAPEEQTARGSERQGVRKQPRQAEERLPKAEADALLARRWRLERYHPRPYAGRIVLFVNKEWHERNPTLGWDAVATGGLEVIPLTGAHNTNLVDNLELTVERLRGCLAGS